MNDKEMKISRKDFTVIIRNDSFEILVSDNRYFVFPAVSAVNADGCEDEDCDGTLSCAISESGDITNIVWTSKSSIWDEKKYTLQIDKENFLYSVSVSGKGSVREVDYFSGKLSSGKSGAVYETSEYMLTQPRFGTDNHYFSMAEDNKISMQLMTPPPLCFPFKSEESAGWLGIGLTAENGEYNFDGFSYKNIGNRARFSVDVSGAEIKNREWHSPSVLGCGGKSEWEVLKKYAAFHYGNGCRPTEYKKEKWWYGPLFCGWGEQAILKWKYHTGDIYGAACEKVYNDISNHLSFLGLNVTALIIDDKWQKEYGTAMPDPEKWESLRAFTDREHSKGRRVLLWLKCWDDEGLPEEECIKKDGKPCGGDPTNPKYINRLKEIVRRLLSDGEGCFGCDGFKIDFADCVPTGEGIETFEPGVRGIELVKRLIKIIYDASKSAKADALVSCSGCHPYFADVTDMARLHDYDLRLRCVNKCMDFRAKQYEIMLPEALIDTDFPAFGCHTDTMNYLRFAPQIGVPDIYRISNTGECEFSNEDIAEIKEIWKKYSEKISQIN